MQDLIIFGIISILIFLAPLLNKITMLPIVVIEILLGAFAFNVGLVSESVVLKEVSHMGFLFLMFLAGIEVDIKSFKTLGSSFLKRVLMYFFVLYSSTIVIVLACNLSIIYIAAFPVMSLGMIMILIQDYGKNEIWLDLSLKIGIVGELISISMLVLLDGYYSFGIGKELYQSIFILFIFIILIIVFFKLTAIIFWWFPSLRLVLIPADGSMNQDIRYSMMLFFMMIVIVSLLKIEAVLGAFISGMVISSFFKTNKELHHKLNDFGFGFLIPLFFVYIGTTLDFDVIFGNKDIIIHAINICFAMIIVRIIATSIVFGSFLKKIKNIFLFTLSGSMPLTFLVATATLGQNIGAIEREQYYSFVLAAIMESILITTIIKVIINMNRNKS
ncbi:cation:proton antiporter [Helicobacter sp. MIT 14-3879]|uniref:cation:proton antiporter n=1 Tax=Helicobacter sp. MIT 14-3879 TaxID=2040649 RepID=UPI000E1E323F|nr:cation:proton antiporter [Helicobacter sp. MIT 14-3879]RDU62653.1 sodium:proton antiporter [Helicobacter sp. MIT 14-3879]